MFTIKTKVFLLKRVLSSRIFAAGVLMTMLAVTLLMVTMKTNVVLIVDGENAVTKITTQQNPTAILKENGILLASTDIVNFTGFENNTGEINILRTVNVMVTADGVTMPLTLNAGTVLDALTQAGVTLSDDDTVNLPIYELLKDGDAITVSRVAYKTVTEKKDIPRETVYQYSSLIQNGRKSLLSAGSNGVQNVTYNEKVVDGQVLEKVQTDSVIVKKPTSDVVLVGQRGTPVSPFDFGYEIVDGRPTHYKSVITGASATGYSAKPGAGTASGRKAVVGTVAVDPKVIPYGTKLYIASADGSFVYGYAIAADTGTALVQRVVDVDLFYATYAESCLNGRRAVNIYILE